MPKGSCACGEYTFEVPEDAQATVVCHCLPCRKFAGSNGSTNGVVPKDKFKQLSGSVKSWTRKRDSGKSVRNVYCETCSTLMCVEAEAAPEIIFFKPGTLDDQEFLDKHPLVQEIYTRNRPACIAALESAQQKEGGS